jgi:hypothetical protein
VAGLGASRTSQEPVAPFAPAGRERFNGSWDYNALESLNVVTGRPEQCPATARRTGAARRPPQTGTGTGTSTGRTGGAGGPIGAPGSRQFVGDAGSGGDRSQEMQYRALMQAENRALTRDLMEIPESLSIRVAPDAVTIIDDLDRTLTFPTDGGKLQKYQLSASRFEARATWDGAMLRKQIEGPRGFRMSETYSLSEDGRRLFVIIRLGEERPNTAPIGSNRVYDRIDQ